jgi:hypothetical protein
VYGVVGQYERPVGEMQEGPIETICIWVDLGIILFSTGTSDIAICFTLVGQFPGSGHEKMVRGIISLGRGKTTTF